MAGYDSRALIERALELASDPSQSTPDRVYVSYEAQTVASCAIAAAIGELAATVSALGIMIGDLAETRHPETD